MSIVIATSVAPLVFFLTRHAANWYAGADSTTYIHAVACSPNDVAERHERRAHHSRRRAFACPGLTGERLTMRIVGWRPTRRFTPDPSELQRIVVVIAAAGFFLVLCAANVRATDVEPELPTSRCLLSSTGR